MSAPISHWNSERPSFDDKATKEVAKRLQERPGPDTLRRIAEIAASCPFSGDGVHLWLFSAALQLHRLKLSVSEIETILEDATSNCGRDMKPDEIESAVRNSAPYLVERRTQNVRRWPARNYDRIYRIVDSGIGAGEMRAKSPAAMPEGQNHAEDVIDALFPGNPLLCVASSKYDCHTKPRDQWRGLLKSRQFIVPSPMAKQSGTANAGNASERCLDNTGPRAFLVVEFDFDAKVCDQAYEPRELLKWAKERGKDVFDISAALHCHLAQLRPLSLVVNSAGKSLHGWYPALNSSDEELYAFLFYAVALGADRATWNASQLVRLPDGRRITESGNQFSTLTQLHLAPLNDCNPIR